MDERARYREPDGFGELLRAAERELQGPGDGEHRQRDGNREDEGREGACEGVIFRDLIFELWHYIISITLDSIDVKLANNIRVLYDRSRRQY